MKRPSSVRDSTVYTLSCVKQKQRRHSIYDTYAFAPKRKIYGDMAFHFGMGVAMSALFLVQRSLSQTFSILEIEWSLRCPQVGIGRFDDSTNPGIYP